MSMDEANNTLADLTKQFTDAGYTQASAEVGAIIMSGSQGLGSVLDLFGPPPAYFTPLAPASGVGRKRKAADPGAGVDASRDSLEGGGAGEPSGPVAKKKKAPAFGPGVTWDCNIKHMQGGVVMEQTVTITKELAWKTYQEQKSMVPCTLYDIKGAFKWGSLLSSIVKQMHPDLDIANQENKVLNKTVGATLSKRMKSWFAHELFESDMDI